MHYSSTFDAVGQKASYQSIDDKERFNTTQRDQFSPNKIKFAAANLNANVPTVFETMAKASRLKLNVDGKPRGLLAHEDFGKSAQKRKEKNALLEAGFSQTSTAFSPRKDDLHIARTRNSNSQIEAAAGRYASQKRGNKQSIKGRANSLVDVHHSRELERRQKQLML